MVAATLFLLRRLVGLVLCLIGAALLVLPGPGLPFLIAGATLLGWGPQMRSLLRSVRARFARRRAPAPADPP